VDDLDHEDAAKRVGISRRTLERLLHAGHHKVTGALIGGHAIQISFPQYVRRKIKGRR
jgi:predicted DNA-binding protein (UPF0251 family)